MTDTLPPELAPYVTGTVTDDVLPTRHFLRNGDHTATLECRAGAWFALLERLEGGVSVWHDQRTLRSEPRMVAWVREWLESGR